MHHAEIEYWAALYERRGLHRYMTFATFMRSPALHVERMDGVEGYRPLLPQQQGVAAELDLADECRRMQERREELEDAMRDPELLKTIEELERRVAHLRRVENGHPFEPMRHQRHPR